MISFAVTHPSMPEGQGQWVMAVDNDRFLVVDSETREFQWLPMAECKFLKVHTPEQPLMVLPVQPGPQNGLAVPEPNRQMRRNGGLYLN